MRASIVRQAVVTVVVLMAIGIALSWIGGGRDAVGQLGWAAALAVGIAAFTAWQRLRTVKRGFLAATHPDFALVPVDPAQWPGIDWKSLDDYAIQLEARGYRRLGDFSLERQPKHARGMARYLGDPAGTCIVELQQFERVSPAPAGTGADLFQVHVAIGSLVGGTVRVMVSDRPIGPVNYMIRDRRMVYASYPGKSLLELVELHRRLCELVTSRSGLPVDSGFTIERYVMLSRERARERRARLEATPTWTLLGDYDRFVANPVTGYSLSEPELKAVKARGGGQGLDRRRRVVTLRCRGHRALRAAGLTRAAPLDRRVRVRHRPLRAGRGDLRPRAGLDRRGVPRPRALFPLEGPRRRPRDEAPRGPGGARSRDGGLTCTCTSSESAAPSWAGSPRSRPSAATP